MAAAAEQRAIPALRSQEFLRLRLLARAPLQFASSTRASSPAQALLMAGVELQRLAPPLAAAAPARANSSAQPLVEAANGTELRERHHECGNGDHRNCQCRQHQHVKEVVHRSPHCADRDPGV